MQKADEFPPTYLDAGYWAHPFGVGPWHFEGETLTVFVETEPSVLAPFIPQPLRPAGPPVFRLTVHALRSDCGNGADWAARNPVRSQFHEAVVAFSAEMDGVAGNWDPFMWTEAEAQLSVGREMYGFSMRLGSVAMTRRPALNGWAAGNIATASASQDGESVFSIGMQFERTGVEASPPPVVSLASFYTRRTLPRAEDPACSDIAFYRTTMQDLRLGEVWSGSGEFNIRHPRLQELNRGKVVGARWSSFEMTKPPAELLARGRVAGVAERGAQ